MALHPSPHILNYIRIPQFDAEQKLHIRLAESSAACHAAVASAGDSELESLEAANDKLAAEVWGITDAELRDIQFSLADLK